MHRWLPRFFAGLLVVLLACDGWLGVACAQGRKVVLTTSDHYRISGLLTEPAGPPTGAAVVLLPMYKQSKESWLPLIPILAAKGIASLAIDMRGHGESKHGPDGQDDSLRVDGRDPVLFRRMHLDAEEAVRALRAQGKPDRRIGLVGASVGCSVALQVVAAGVVPIRAVVLMTPGKAYLGLDSMADIRKWPVSGLPLLIVSSRAEAPKGALAIHQQLQGKGAELKLFDQEEIHGTNMFGEVDGVEERIATWLAAHLQAPDTPR